MKAIAMGVGAGVLVLLALVQFAPKASADHDCPGTGCGNGFCTLFGIPDIVQAAQDGSFGFGVGEDEGSSWMQWCEDGEQHQTIAAMEIIAEDPVECFDDDPDGFIDAVPDFFVPAHCMGTFNVGVSAVLDSHVECDAVTVTLRAFVWAPFEFDEEAFTVLEF